jgi:hypothetical protein
MPPTLRPKSRQTEKATNEGGKGGFVVFAIKPLFMPTLERCFQWKIEEIMVQMSLDADIDMICRLAVLSWYFKKK